MKGDIVHIFNRGVDKRRIFYSKKDYIRFLDNIIDFNTTGGSDLSYFRRRQTHLSDVSDIRCPTERPNLVNVLHWCFMPNHVHLMLEENIDGGIGMFSRKVFGGYTKYFNEHNNRSGVLFQGPTKTVSILEDRQLMYLPIYIILNPLKILEPEWKEKGIKDINEAMNFLKGYKWSSYYENLKDSVYERRAINKSAVDKLFYLDQQNYSKEIRKWINDYKSLTDIVGHRMSDNGE